MAKAAGQAREQRSEGKSGKQAVMQSGGGVGTAGAGLALVERAGPPVRHVYRAAETPPVRRGPAEDTPSYLAAWRSERNKKHGPE